MTELEKILKHKTFSKSYETLRGVPYPQLPNAILGYISQLWDTINLTDENINEYHLFNDIYQDLKEDSSLDYFIATLGTDVFSEEGVRNVIREISDCWVTYDDAERDVDKFLRFMDTL